MNSFPVPAGLSYFPFQAEGIQFALEHPGTLLADSMGLGKSIQSVGLINALPGLEQILVVCPASMRIPWQRELEKWLTRVLSIGIIGVTKESPDLIWASKNIIIINYDRLHQHTAALKAKIWDLVILDECHLARSPEARRTKIVVSLKAQRRLALSGTPLLNRPIELYPVLSWLSPSEWPVNGYWAFAHRYCGACYNGFGWDVSGASNLPELSHRLRSMMIRRVKSEVLPELPSKIRTVIELVPTPGMKQAIKRERAVYELPSLNVDYASIDWDNLSRVCHETALAKLPLVIDYVREMLEGGVPKVVVFAYHRDVIAQLREGLRQYCPVILIGGMGSKERQASIDGFHAEPSVRVFLGNIQAAGVGITLAPASLVRLVCLLR